MSDTAPNDDIRHLEQAIDFGPGEPAFVRAGRAVNLLGTGLAMVPRCEWDYVFPNDFAAIACLSRAYRQLRAACTLLMWGYYAEIWPILRSTYECCGLARMLAHDPPQAEKWVRRQHWFPDREVRKWFVGSGSNNAISDSAEILTIYSSAYRELSRRAHPTAIACVSALDMDGGGPSPKLETDFVPENFSASAAEIAASAIFACFSLRNSAVDERAISPDWRQAVYDLAREITSSDMPHLERDWDEENRRYEELQRRVAAASGLREAMKSHPGSWDNLQSQSDG